MRRKAPFIIWRCSLPSDPIRFDIAVRFNAPALRSELQRNARLAQVMLDDAVKRDTDPYVPMDTGMLARSVQTASPSGSGEVVYDTPYAHRLYYGLSFGFKKLHHPLATAQWFEEAKAVHGKRWIAEVERILKGGNGR